MRDITIEGSTREGVKIGKVDRERTQRRGRGLEEGEEGKREAEEGGEG